MIIASFFGRPVSRVGKWDSGEFVGARIVSDGCIGPNKIMLSGPITQYDDRGKPVFTSPKCSLGDDEDVLGLRPVFIEGMRRPDLRSVYVGQGHVEDRFNCGCVVDVKVRRCSGGVLQDDVPPVSADEVGDDQVKIDRLFIGKREIPISVDCHCCHFISSPSVCPHCHGVKAGAHSPASAKHTEGEPQRRGN